MGVSEDLKPLKEKIQQWMKDEYTEELDEDLLQNNKKWTEFPFVLKFSEEGTYKASPKADLFIPHKNKHIFIEFEYSNTNPFRNIVKYWRWILDSKQDNKETILIHVIFLISLDLMV